MKKSNLKLGLRKSLPCAMLFCLILFLYGCGPSQPADLTVCNYLEVDFPESEGGTCCRRLALINSSPTEVYSGLSTPFIFKLVSENGEITSWEENMGAMLANSSQEELTWAGIPQGRVELGEICFADNHGGQVKFEWYNTNREQLCSESIDVYCSENNPITNPITNCCTYNVHLVQQEKDNPFVKKVRITALDGTEIINSDPDFFEELVSTSEIVEWESTSPFFPPGSAIDNDFTLYVKSSGNPHQFQVDWFDSNDNIVSRHLVELDCNQDFDDDVDWSNFTSLTNINNTDLFAFFSVDDTSEDCGRDEMTYKTDQCTTEFSYTAACESNTKKLQLNGPDGFDIYKWFIYDEDRNDNDSPLYELEGKNPQSVVLTNPGEYEVDLMAINIDQTGEETCYGESLVTIYEYDPKFTYERRNCDLLYRFKAEGFINNQIEKVEWASNGLNEFPEEGNSINYQFTEPGTYLIEMTLVDIYGCTHPYTENISISNECSPKFVHSYQFCDSDCRAGNVVIDVSFKNVSEGGICPITYIWDFGDGNTVEFIDNDNSRESISQSFSMDGSSIKCKDGKNIPIKLTMKDNSGCEKVYTKSIRLASVSPEIINIKNCDDGKYMLEANMAGTWSISAGSISQGLDGDFTLEDDEYNGIAASNCIVVKFADSGRYEVTFEGLSQTGGRCKINKSLDVAVECCAKNERVKDRYRFTSDGKRYKMKYKFVQRQRPFVHNVKAKTKLRRLKYLPFPKKWSYYTSHRADEIHASFDGQIYKPDHSSGVTCSGIFGACPCRKPQLVSAEKTRSNKKRAKAKEGSLGKFRSKSNSIESTHYVIVNGQKKEKKLKLGEDSDCYNWWTDWF